MSSPQTEHGLDPSIDEFGPELRAALIEAGTGKLGRDATILYTVIVGYHARIRELEAKVAALEPTEEPTT